MRSLLVMSTAAVLAVGLLGAPSAGAGTDNRAHARAAATTTLGQAGPSLVVCAGTVPAGVLLSTEGANAASYLATSNGVLTSFTHVANNVSRRQAGRQADKQAEHDAEVQAEAQEMLAQQQQQYAPPPPPAPVAAAPAVDFE